MVNFTVLNMNFCKSIQFDYVNWKGKKSARNAEPVEIIYASNDYHPEKQWLLVAIDLDKGESRTFAMKDMSNVKYRKLRGAING